MKEPPIFFRMILKLLNSGNYPAKIARILNITPRQVYYWVNKAGKEGFIELKTKGAVKFYCLTHYGSNYISKNLTRGDIIWRLHHFAVKYPLLEQPRVVVDWDKVAMRNWDRFIGSELGLRVEMTTKHIIVHADSIRGDEPYKLAYLAGSECDRIARYLESKFEMRLGTGSLMRVPHFAVRDPVAERISEHFEFSGDLGKIDHSEGYGELELYDPRFAKNYMLTFTVLPELVQRQHQDLNEIKGIMQIFGEAMKEHVALIKQLQETTKVLKEAVEETKKERESRSQ